MESQAIRLRHDRDSDEISFNGRKGARPLPHSLAIAAAAESVEEKMEDDWAGSPEGRRAGRHGGEFLPLFFFGSDVLVAVTAAAVVDSLGYSKAAHVALGLLLTAIITLVISSTVIAFLDQNTSTGLTRRSRTRSRGRGRGIDFRRG